MVRLPLACLIDPCIRIIARPSEISNVSEQMSLGILHSQVAELRANFEKRLRRRPPGPTLNRQSSYQHKPTPIDHLVEYSPQPWCESWELIVLRADSSLNFANLLIGQALFPIIARC
jgi:hypothetical protein